MRKDNTNNSRFSGSTGIAIKAGVNAAIVHEKIVYYIYQNQSKNKSKNVTISADKLAEKLPFLTKRQVLYAIDKLQQQQLITVQDWQGHNNGTQKTYSVSPSIIKQYYDDNRYKFVTHRDKIVTPPLQNCHGSYSSLIKYIDNNIGNNIEKREMQKEKDSPNDNPPLPQIFDFRDPLCSQWKQYLPQSFVSQEHYDTIRKYVDEFGIDTVRQILSDARTTYPDIRTNALLLDKADTQLSFIRYDTRKKNIQR